VENGGNLQRRRVADFILFSNQSLKIAQEDLIEFLRLLNDLPELFKSLEELSKFSVPRKDLSELSSSF